MTRYSPLWLQQQTYAASVDRRLVGMMYPVGACDGCKVSVSSGMTVNVAAGTVAVPTSNNTGSVLCASDAVEPVTLAAAPASGSNRYDLVICQARGNDLDGGANNDFLFTTVTGTAAASPAVPALPNNAALLAQIYVPGGSASVTAGNIADRRNLQAKDVYARAHLSANTSVTAGQQAPFNVATRDPLGMYSVTNKNFAVPVAGHYLVVGALNFQSNSTTTWALSQVRKNGVIVALAGGGFMGLNTWDMMVGFNEIVVCAAGDTIDVAWNGSPVLLTGNADSSKTYCTIQLLHF